MQLLGADSLHSRSSRGVTPRMMIMRMEGALRVRRWKMVQRTCLQEQGWMQRRIQTMMMIVVVVRREMSAEDRHQDS